MERSDSPSPALSPIRKKKRRRLGIRGTLTLQLLLIVSFSLVAVNLIVSRQIQQGNEQQIAADMRALQSNAAVYTRQSLMFNQQNNDEEGFRNVATDLLSQLRSATGRDIAAYSLEGVRLAGTGPQRDDDPTDDLRCAIGGKAAFHLQYAGSVLTVRFSCPAVVSDKTVGILRFTSDYSSLVRQGRDISRIVLIVTAAVFLLIFIMVQIAANRVVRPVLRLAEDSARAARKIAKGASSPPSGSVGRLTRRRDEIGQLSANYEGLLRTIDTQFRRIRDDNDHIRRLYEYDQTLFNNVTHELKTPLTTIQGYAELLEDDGGRDPALYARAVGHIAGESRRLHDMVVRLLDMSSLSREEETQPVDLSALADSVCDAMALKAGRYGNVIRRELPSSLILAGKEGRLRELLINLLDNAIKYGEPGREIALSLKTREMNAVLTVANAGPGIPPDRLEDIFTPFYRLDKQASREMGSSGLGLSICRKIAEEHGGTIRAESIPGDITRFIVTLPLGKEALDP